MNISRPYPGQIRGPPVRDGMALQLWEQGRQQAAIPQRPGLQLVHDIFELGDVAGSERFVAAAAAGASWRFKPILVPNTSHIHIK
ncbi:hypothetical protein KQ300_13415 [Synechococcus sp. CS-1331]|uniref:hypothetical protein n=1 Tax=Synechococcus sp. CS-1331 TaxID=2847973 RepID=UPI00223A89D3|nr:hypothetical protein [Synechococcus sp. CS-1331]MCT0229180.1 hypothetical protein [Synechococcus sp. CS-1331]